MGNEYTGKYHAPGSVINTKEVVRFVRSEPLGAKIYLFRCTRCGFERESRTTDVRRKNRCLGCIVQRGNDDMISSLMRSYQRHAEKRKIEFHLNETQFEDIISKLCWYCGAESSNSMKWGKREYRYNGIDRVDSKVGYSINNCVPCCKWCNYGKSNLSKKDFLDWIKRVYKHSVKGNEKT